MRWRTAWSCTRHCAELRTQCLVQDQAELRAQCLGPITPAAKRFLRFCWEIRAVEHLPRNLDNRSLSRAFAVTAKEIEVFCAEELRAVYKVVSGQSRLHFLLCLNAGFLASDINDLRQSEVDWSAGTITRRRTKTREH
jgi:integrase